MNWSGIRALRFLAVAGLLIVCVAASPQRGRFEFRVVDVWVSTSQPLAAWQVELEAQHEGVRLVGVEAGGAPGFTTAPFYDPAALEGGRMILGAFSLEPASGLPRGRVRVATLHLMVESGVPLQFRQRLEAAADEDGRVIEASLAVRER